MTKYMYDVIIIWAGSAWLPAAIYATRYNLKTLVIWELMGGALTQSHSVENYPWFNDISWKELMQRFEDQAKLYWAEIISSKVLSVDKQEDGTFILKTYKEEYMTKTIIFAWWNKYKKLGHEKEEQFIWKWLSYCATCDWMFFKNQEVSIIWWWNTALTEAMYLSEICSKVNLIHRRDTFRAENVLIDKIKNNPKIELHLNEELKDFREWKFGWFDTLILSSWKEINSVWLFIAIWNEPDTESIKNLNINLDKEGYIIVNEKQETNVKGVYAAWDITTNSNKFKQTIMSAAEWALSANSVHEYLMNQ